MRRWGLLWAGLLLTSISLLLVLTPLQFEAEKMIFGTVPDEYYPELFWLAYGLPPSILVLLAGVGWAYWAGRQPR